MGCERKMKRFLASLKKFTRSRTFMFITSVVIAFGLWLFVTSTQNSEISQVFSAIVVDTAIDDTIPESEGLMLTTNKKYSVNITVTGKRNDLMELSTRKSEIKAVADYSAINKEGVYAVPVNIEFPIRDVELSGARPKINVEFDKKLTQQIPVKVMTTGTLGDDFFISNEEITVSPLYINITGPAKTLNKILSAKCTIDISNRKETISTSANYTFVSVSDEEITDPVITVDNDKVDVKIPVYKYKVVPLSVNIVNSSGGNDANFAIVTVSPSEIKVAGDESKLANLNQITLDVIDMAELSETTLERNVTLDNDLVNVEKVQKATIKIESKNVVTKSFDVDRFEIINEPKGQKCAIETKSISVTVRGTNEFINKLTAGEITAVCDLKGEELIKGKNQVAVSFRYPKDYLVGTSGKYSVIVSAK